VTCKSNTSVKLFLVAAVLAHCLGSAFVVAAFLPGSLVASFLVDVLFCNCCPEGEESPFPVFLVVCVFLATTFSGETIFGLTCSSPSGRRSRSDASVGTAFLGGAFGFLTGGFLVVTAFFGVSSFDSSFSSSLEVFSSSSSSSSSSEVSAFFAGCFLAAGFLASVFLGLTLVSFSAFYGRTLGSALTISIFNVLEASLAKVSLQNLDIPSPCSTSLPANLYLGFPPCLAGSY
jgi:hypothetical protein